MYPFIASDIQNFSTFLYFFAFFFCFLSTDAPNQTLPYIEYHGKKYGEALPIARFLARKYSKSYTQRLLPCSACFFTFPVSSFFFYFYTYKCISFLCICILSLMHISLSPFYLSPSLCLCVCVCLSICLSVCISAVCLSVYLSLCLSSIYPPSLSTLFQSVRP